MARINNLIAILLFFILVCNNVLAEESINIFNTSKCFDTMYVKVKSDYNNTNYNIEGFKKQDTNLWYRVCSSQKQNVVVNVFNNETIKMNFIIEYYIAPALEVKRNSSIKGLTAEEMENENNKRTININNIIFNKEIKKEIFKWPELENKYMIFIIIGIILLSIIIGIIIIIKWLFKDNEKEYINEAKLQSIKNSEEPTREEIEEFIRNNT